jgi:hypothetical protein
MSFVIMNPPRGQSRVWSRTAAPLMEQDMAFPGNPGQNRRAVVTLFGATSSAIVTFFYFYGLNRGSPDAKLLGQGPPLGRWRATRS